MADKTLTNDLESLSMTWSERVKNIRQMAKNDESGRSAYTPLNPALPDSELTVPADDELFAEPIPESLSAEDIFVGDPAIYKSLETHYSANATPISQSTPLPDPASYKQRKHHSVFLKILAGFLALLLVGLLVYGGMFGWLPMSIVASPEKAASQQTASQETDSEITQETESILGPEEPATLQIAADYYQEGELLRAAAVYRRLLHSLSENSGQKGLKDYLQLNIALCMKDTATNESIQVFKKTALSNSPIVRIIANYQLSMMDMKRQQFMSAKARAYQAAGMIDLIDFNREWSYQIRRNCYFLAAEAVSRQVLSLADGDKELPAALWPHFKAEDNPLINLDENTIYDILSMGTQRLNKALLEPKIISVAKDDLPCWTVTCKSVSVEELISRFATNAGYDVRWEVDLKSANLRNRSICLALNAVDDYQLTTISAGSTGLLAYFDKNKVITVCNPMDYSYVSDQIELLNNDAISCWKKYLLTFYEDQYLPNVHFALGLLKTREGLVAEALAEYKIIPGRYQDSELGPSALVRSATIKTDLHDYRGAYDDLKEAVEQYSNHDNIEQTYLSLGKAASRIDNDKEAAKLYSKVYYLNNSVQSQIAAAYEAGRIYYQTQNFKSAEQWLSRYVSLVDDQSDQNFYEGCLLLGKTWLALGNHKLASQALRTALQGRLSQQDYVQAITTLVDSYLKQERFVEALEILNQTTSHQLSQTDSTGILLLRSQVLRAMGLTDKAVVLLTEREEYMIDEIEKARISYELSECYIEQKRLDLAYKKLVAILEHAETGPLAHKAALKLTDVCLQMDLDDQALRVGTELLNLHPDTEIEQKTLQLLATVYQKQKKYDRAALVLMGQWE